MIEPKLYQNVLNVWHGKTDAKVEIKAYKMVKNILAVTITAKAIKILVETGMPVSIDRAGVEAGIK